MFCGHVHHIWFLTFHNTVHHQRLLCRCNIFLMHHGKRSTSKTRVVQILHRNTCHCSIRQNNGVVHANAYQNSDLQIKNYNKSCINSCRSHRIFHRAVFSIISHIFHTNQMVTESLMSTTAIKKDKQDQPLAVHRITKWEKFQTMVNMTSSTILNSRAIQWKT